jgi:IS30 family transposase
MEKSFKGYSKRYNNIARKILNFKTPNEIVEEYFSKNAT